jgi:hypothetical protein
MSDHVVGRLKGGTVSQSAIEKQAAHMGSSPRGLKVSAVVVSTYVYDEPNGANVVGTPAESRAVYCDCVCIDPRFHGIPIPRAKVTQSQGGLHWGEVWIPQAADLEESGDPVNKSAGTNLSNTNGDHVIVEWLNDDFGQPVITGALPHPINDIGNVERNAGHRVRSILSDGRVRLTKHRGSFWGLDDCGNWVVDTTRAHDGTLEEGMREPEPALGGTEGNHVYKVPEGGKFEINLTKGAQVGDGSDSDAEWTKVVIENNKVTISNEGGESILLENKDGDTTLKIGDGDKHVALVEHLEAMWVAWQKQIAGWQLQGVAGTTFSTIVGPAFQVLNIEAAPPGPAESAPWDSAINSTKVSLPDG